MTTILKYLFKYLRFKVLVILTVKIAVPFKFVVEGEIVYDFNGPCRPSDEMLTADAKGHIQETKEHIQCNLLNGKHGHVRVQDGTVEAPHNVLEVIKKA